MTGLATGPVLDAIEKAGTLVLTAHDRPDGDALGSVLGLARILRARGRPVRLTGCQPLREAERFLLGEDRFEDFDPAWISPGTLLVVLDCGSPGRAEAALPWLERGGLLLNIDHHHSNERYGTVHWVDSSASSTSEMVERLARAAGWFLPPEAAGALWAGLVSDTGRFGYENTLPEALRCGARLVEAGARPAEIHAALFQNRPLGELRIEGRAIASLELRYGGRLGLVRLAWKDFLELGCRPEDANEVIAIPRSLRGVRVSLFFYEIQEGVSTKLSIRSAEPFDATGLARRFGGGGHQRAAGCELACPLAEAERRVFETIEEIWGPLLNEEKGGEG